MDIQIDGGRVLIADSFEQTTVCIGDGMIGAVGSVSNGAARIDACGLLVLPGVVDIHGDAFERPRPGVHFEKENALFDTDRQLIANGITSVHGVIWSWEPRLCSAANARAIPTAMEQLRPRLGPTPNSISAMRPSTSTQSRG